MLRHKLFIMTKRLLILTAILLVVISSCEKECYHKPKTMLNADFFTIEDEEELEVTLEGVSVYGVGREDSLLYENADVGRISLLLDGNSEETGFVMQVGDMADTLTFHHTETPFLYSYECGYILHFEIKDYGYTTNFIDSIDVVRTKITHRYEKHIKVYF